MEQNSSTMDIYERHNHACMNCDICVWIRGAPRQCQNVVLASELRARAAVTLQFWHFATSTSNDKNRHDKVWDRHIHDKIKRR